MKKITLIIIGVSTMLIIITYINFNSSTQSFNGTDTKLDLFVTINEIDVNYNKANLSLKLSYTGVNDLKYSNEIDVRANSGKISQINDLSFAYSSSGIDRVEHFKFKNPLQIRVVDSGQINEFVYEEQNVDMQINSITPSWLFPFDGYHLNLHFTLFDSTGRRLIPNIHYSFKDRTLVIINASQALNKQLITTKTRNQFIDSSLSIRFIRPFNVMLIFVIVLLLAYIIVLLTIFKTNGKHIYGFNHFEMLVLNLTIILTFPDLRNYVVPESLIFSAIFDYSAILIWVLTIFNIFKLLSNKLDLNNTNQIAQKSLENSEVDKVNK